MLCCGAQQKFPSKLKKCSKGLGVPLPKKSPGTKNKNEIEIDAEHKNRVKTSGDSTINAIIDILEKEDVKPALLEEYEKYQKCKADLESVESLRRYFEEENVRLKKNVADKENQLRDARKENKRLADENEKYQLQSKEAERLADENMRYQTHIEETERNYTAEIKNLKQQIQEESTKSTEKISHLQTEKEAKENIIKELRDALHACNCKVDSEVKEKEIKDNEIAALKIQILDDEKQHQQNLEKLQVKSNQTVQILHQEYKNREDEFHQNIAYLQRQLQQLQTQEAQSRQTIDHLQSNVVAERKAKEDALTRLSAAAASKLRDKNPGITDLSDPNRPLKLSEKMSELYDNEWTNAMEKLEDLEIDENKGIEIMLDIVTMLFDRFCHLGQRQLENISKVAVVPDFDGENDLDKIPELPIEIMKPLKDFRKAHADIAIQRLQQTVAKDCLADKVDSKCLESCTEYIASCTELVWLMQVQDPPVHIEWDINPDDDFDTNTMRSYTKSGKYVDYVVWPILYLHKGGPLLCKGVVQGKKTKKTKTEAQAEGQNKTFDDGEPASKKTNTETEVDGTNIQNGNDIQDENNHTDPSNSSQMNLVEPPRSNGNESTAAQTNEANHTSEDSQGENGSKSDPSFSSNGDDQEEDSSHPIPHSTEAAEPNYKEREESPEEESKSSHSLNEEKDGDTTSDTPPTYETAAGPLAGETCEEGRGRSKSSGQSSQGSDNREYFDAVDKPYEPEEKYSDCRSDVPYSTDSKTTNYEEELD